MTFAFWREWGLSLAVAGVEKLTLVSYIGTAKSFLCYINLISQEDVTNRLKPAWDDILRTARASDPTQAPCMMHLSFMALTKNAKATFMLALGLGIRISSLSTITPTNVWKNDDGTFSVQIVTFKWLPEERSRVGRIKCACTLGYGNEINKDCCIIHTLGMPRIPIDMGQFLFELEKIGCSGHSAKVTLNILAQKIICQETSFKPSWDRYYERCGWSLTKTKPGQQQKLAMFNRYARFADSYNANFIIKADTPVRDALGYWKTGLEDTAVCIYEDIED